MNELQAQFREEVLERWGNTETFKEFETVFTPKSKRIQNEQMVAFYSLAQDIFERLAMYENNSADCSEVQAIVHE
ncbi:TipAS antibiotic-recognition domain-containing protein [Blautia coccoides]|uniref:TipAS antibiotic-recognition domain-containing protein n=1 Tax=Blautia TaxID=572511 RepID=UPI00210E8933|nr:TipAS antibiotic-recognition domain-containing protein [Blautia coccoides]